MQNLREGRLQGNDPEFRDFKSLYARSFLALHFAQFINAMPPRHLRNPGPKGARVIFLFQHCAQFQKNFSCSIFRIFGPTEEPPADPQNVAVVTR